MIDRGAAASIARRLEELLLNASGAFQSLLYDGWLLGYRPGPTKRLRCVNAFYASTLPLEQKVEHCIRFYASIGLPAIFRMLPFSHPPELEAWLQRAGWVSFERTLVQHARLHAPPVPAAVPGSITLLPVTEWHAATAGLFTVPAEALAQQVARARSYPLPHAGAVLERDGEVVACGMLKLEGDHAGLFVVNTAEQHRGQGFGRAIVAALLGEAVRRGARAVYLQVTADNVAAIALYQHFGFVSAYDYWYRARPGEQG
ncbi:MAG: GNAT family N-acetyltransferase [Casimicrobiaceae bacterium]